MNEPGNVNTAASGTAPTATTPLAAPPSKRLLSIDALRGFDMFWIVGGEEVVHALYHAWPVAITAALAQQMSHKSWTGIAAYDLIFPTFVFIVGVSLVFSLTKSLQTQGKAASIRKILTRGLILYLLGVIVYGGISKGWEEVRWLGVLQRIALSYTFAAIFFCLFSVRGLVTACISLLLGYWLLATFVPIRDFNLERQHLESLGLDPTDSRTREMFNAATNRVTRRFDDGLNLPQHIDYQYLPGRKWDGAYDPEGLLSTMGGIASCLLGVFAGLLLRNGAIPDRKKVAWLAIAGVIGILAGLFWGLQFPVIKKIWTSSYVLVAGGIGCLLLALFYQVIEIWQWRRWCTPFVWIGMNPITIYLIFQLLPVNDLTRRLVGGPIAESLGHWGDVLVSLTVVFLMFTVVRFLYNRKIFLRV